MITDLAKGKTLSEAMKVQSKTVSKALGKLPPIKEHCSHLAEQALKAAIKDYLKSKKQIK
jgi:nitrogen fixation NifU-like protein